MRKKQFSQKAKNALLLGGMCSVAYLAVYVARNALSAASPQILQGGVFNTEQIGNMSSVYFITYAIGQLINGTIGDKVKGKYMISFGLMLAAIGNFALPYLSGSPSLAVAFYGFSGFCLAMIYGPMTKMVAENAEEYAAKCSVGYTLASLLGSPVAGLVAAAVSWRSVFFTSGGILLAMGMICLMVFALYEKQGVIRYGKYQQKEKQFSKDGIKLLIKRQIIRFTLVAILTGVVRTTVVFWLPTYLSEYLQFSPDTAALIFTVATLVLSASVFFAVFAQEKLRNMQKVLLIAFVCSAVCFLAVFFVQQKVANIVLLVLAILFGNGASNVMWSYYCPSLRDTGMVSGATGFLDFCSYMAASAASKIFANAVGDVGWKGLVLAWFVLMVCGVAVSLPAEKLKIKSKIIKGGRI